MQLLDEVRRAVESNKAQKMLFILHCYGSHFSYHQRYPREFAHFRPDDDVAISREHVQTLRNAYDNSILYTDFFLSKRSSTCADCAGLRRRCSTAPTTARTSSTTGANASCTLRPRRRPTSSTSLRWRGSPTLTGRISPTRPLPPRQTPRYPPRPTRCSTPWPTWLRSGELHRHGRVAGQRGLRPHPAAPLSERPQRGRTLPQDGPRREDMEVFRKFGIEP